MFNFRYILLRIAQLRNDIAYEAYQESPTLKTALKWGRANNALYEVKHGHKPGTARSI